MIKGILLDIDGTLVLSNDAHARAWVEAFAESGYEVAFDKVRRLIGMGGDKLITTLYPNLSEEEGAGRTINQRRGEIVLQKYAPTLTAAPGSRQLVEELHKLGLKTVAASSAKKAELSVLLQAAEVDDLLTEATTSDDVENSKPDPDIVTAALNAIKLSAEEVVMVGDTPYDIKAAAKAGVRCIAVRTGGWADDDLQGAMAIYDNPADLIPHLSDIIKK